jgi:uncharacterized protein (DUF433 family)
MTLPTFLDTSYILSLVNTRDRFYQRARATSSLVSSPFLTTEAVLIEVGNSLSQARWRPLGAKTVNWLRHSPDIEVIPVDSLQRRAEQNQKTLDALAEDWLNQRLGLERYPDLEWREELGGWRTGIRGTTIDVYTVVGYSQVGYGPQEIADGLLPRLTIEQMHVAWRYYAEHPDEIDRILAEAQTEVSKARLYRRLGPEGYHPRSVPAKELGHDIVQDRSLERSMRS